MAEIGTTVRAAKALRLLLQQLERAADAAEPTPRTDTTERVTER